MFRRPRCFQGSSNPDDNFSRIEADNVTILNIQFFLDDTLNILGKDTLFQNVSLDQEGGWADEILWVDEDVSLTCKNCDIEETERPEAPLMILEGSTSFFDGMIIGNVMIKNDSPKTRCQKVSLDNVYLNGVSSVAVNGSVVLEGDHAEVTYLYESIGCVILDYTPLHF